MTIREVMFDSVEDVKRFVQQSEKQPEDIDMCYDSCIVDGRFVLKILSLGIHKKLNVVIHDWEVKGRSGYKAFFFDGRSCLTALLICFTDLKGRFYNEPFL